jgi:undecaprenyl-diphosphatase
MVGFEESIFRFINGLAGHVPAIDRVMILASDARPWMILAAVLFVVGLRMKNKPLIKALLCCLAALALTDFISFEVVKPIVARERPCWSLPHVTMVLNRCGGSYGFTSNHAANSFAVWYVVARIFGSRSISSISALTLATLVSISRVYLGVHFFGDVVGGAILGSLMSFALFAIGFETLGERLANKILPQ